MNLRPFYAKAALVRLDKTYDIKNMRKLDTTYDITKTVASISITIYDIRNNIYNIRFSRENYDILNMIYNISQVINLKSFVSKYIVITK